MSDRRRRNTDLKQLINVLEGFQYLTCSTGDCLLK